VLGENERAMRCCMLLSFEIVSACPDARLTAAWNECLDECTFASHYTAPAFFSEPYFRDFTPFAILALDGATVVGVLTGTSRDGATVCGMHASPQLCIRAGAPAEQVAECLAAGLQARLTKQQRLVTVYAWSRLEGFRRAGYRELIIGAPMATTLLDLSRPAELLFREFSETRRNKIRRAIKAGVTVTEMDVAEDFAAYYELYTHWCEFKHIAPQPYDVQRAAFENRDNRLVLVARHDARIVGVSTFRFRNPGIIEYAANVSRREETRIRQNDLLLWKAIEWAATARLRYFSMAGSHFFLQKFGGALHVTYRYTKDRTLLRRHDVAQALRSVAITALHHLPEGVQQRLKRLRRADAEQD
jgi:hypothetical protein